MVVPLFSGHFFWWGISFTAASLFLLASHFFPSRAAAFLPPASVSFWIRLLLFFPPGFSGTRLAARSAACRFLLPVQLALMVLCRVLNGPASAWSMLLLWFFLLLFLPLCHRRDPLSAWLQVPCFFWVTCELLFLLP